MKKLALILGSLLLAATASAKEVVAAPVVVEEVVVEEATVVETPTWKPSGSFYWEAEYRGHNEHSTGEKSDRVYNDMVGEFAVTEKDTLWFEWEAYNGTHGGDDGEDDYDDSQDMEVRWYHNFGYLGDSKIDMTSEINIEFRDDDGGSNHNYYSARMYFDFAEYVSGNENFNITKLALRPRVQYNDYDEMDGAGQGDYAIGTGLDLLLLAETQTENLGLFEYELSFYNTYFDGNSSTRRGYDADEGSTYVDFDDNGDAIKSDSNGMANQIEAYLYHTIDLWKSESKIYSLDFKHEGGLDPITWTESEDSVTVYYEPRFRLHQKINEATTLRYSAGAYYKNYESNGADHTADFRWEPRVGVAIKTVF